MLQTAKPGKSYWAEAVSTSVYIKSRAPTKAVRGEVPLKKWSGVDVNLSHLRVFGCAAYMEVRKALWKEMDSKTKQYIFVGYGEETKGYRLSDPNKPTNCTMAHNVDFIEKELPGSKPDEAEIQFSELNLSGTRTQFHYCS